jgi:predicted deacylase
MGGAKDGPVLYMQAGIHGDEVTGVEVLRRALAAINPRDLAGTVVAVPIANVPAYLTRTRAYMHEERRTDVYDSFPGNPAGLLSERIAHTLLEAFMRQAQFSIDFHAGLDGCEIVPFTYVWPNDDQHGTLAFRESQALAYGTKYVYYHDASKKFGTIGGGGLTVEADRLGIPVMIAEMGESRRVSRQFVDIGVRGVRNILINLGMMQGDIVKEEPQRKFSEFKIAHADVGGALELLVDLGAEVGDGQLLAYIHDVFGEIVTEVKSPAAGFVQRVMRLGSVNTGAEVAWIGV